MLDRVPDFGPGSTTISELQLTESEIPICLCGGFQACPVRVGSLLGVVLSEGFYGRLTRNGLFGQILEPVAVFRYLARC